jgi:hypothetical protein
MIPYHLDEESNKYVMGSAWDNSTVEGWAKLTCLAKKQIDAKQQPENIFYAVNIDMPVEIQKGGIINKLHTYFYNGIGIVDVSQKLACNSIPDPPRSVTALIAAPLPSDMNGKSQSVHSVLKFDSKAKNILVTFDLTNTH